MLLGYYIIIFCFYIIELALLNLALIYYSNVEILNFIIRLLASIAGIYLLRRFIFKRTMYFFPKFIIASILNPLLSSLIFALLLRLELIGSIFICKFFADLFTSLLTFMFLIDKKNES